MKWQTIKQAKSAKTAKQALELSFEHWSQLYAATQEELIDGSEQNTVSTGGDYCACCWYFGGMDNYCTKKERRCSLNQSNYGYGGCDCCNGLWEKAYCAWNDFLDNPTVASFNSWHTACKEVRDFIGEKINEKK